MPPKKTIFDYVSISTILNIMWGIVVITAALQAKSSTLERVLAENTEFRATMIEQAHILGDLKVEVVKLRVQMDFLVEQQKKNAR